MKKLIFYLTFFITTSFFSQIEKGPKIVFDKQSHDFGTIKINSDPYCYFEFTNTGNETLVISEAKGSCGCTIPVWPIEPVYPNQKAKITVRYDTSHLGPINKSVTIISNAINEPIKVIRIIGEVISN